MSYLNSSEGGEHSNVSQGSPYRVTVDCSLPILECYLSTGRLSHLKPYAESRPSLHSCTIPRSIASFEIRRLIPIEHGATLDRRIACKYQNLLQLDVTKLPWPLPFLPLRPSGCVVGEREFHLELPFRLSAKRTPSGGELAAFLT